jgi:hypothetical protein
MVHPNQPVGADYPDLTGSLLVAQHFARLGQKNFG